MSSGQCWAAQMRDRVPLLFLARRQYLVALTDRRVLVFERSRRGPTAQDLVLGKRYESFTVDRVRRHRPLLQVVMRGTNGNKLALEFRFGQRELAGELIARLTPRQDGARATAATTRTPPVSAPAAPATVTPAPPPVEPAEAAEAAEPATSAAGAELPTKRERKRAEKQERKSHKGKTGKTPTAEPTDATDPVIDRSFWGST
jgi:hypothetical protein